jgi:glycine cleavage system H protein
MSVPKDRRYLQTHEWHQLDGDIVTLGITQHAADELTDITYVKLPTIGQSVSANSPFGEIESVKATSDLYTGVSGTVSTVNAELNTNPGLVNADPFGKGWIAKIQVPNRGDFDKLLSAEDYLKKTE